MKRLKRVLINKLVGHGDEFYNLPLEIPDDRIESNDSNPSVGPPTKKRKTMPKKELGQIATNAKRKSIVEETIAEMKAQSCGPMSDQGGLQLLNVLNPSFGGRGEAYDAREANRNEEKAKLVVKTIRLDAVEKIDEIAAEAHYLRRLTHPNIVSLHSTLVMDSQIYIVLHFASYGGDILSSSYQNGIPEKAISLVCKQLFTAIQYIHKQNILHRSIRASHILLDDSGTVKLSGFRYARCLQDNPMNAITDFDAHLESSLLWLAPEVLAQDLHGYGLPSDIYSLGITMCEIANGYPPFSDMQLLEMMLAKSRGTIPRLLDSTTCPAKLSKEQNARTFSPDFHALVMCCLSLKPSLRLTIGQCLETPFIAKRRKKPLPSYIPQAVPIDKK
ncbi:hypothetical protein WR25_04927 [Diploscapter pachys]|uniref:Protein kinase domain-containing protein n=1 Tax=Diploscapter pachys TaxID=2018661 RepID=A0A2A2JQS0_9BILA|nr:hypothetical protein WR25_04927 [Diploscapter pachys]